MEWVRSLIRKAAALFSRGAPSPAENTAIPAEVPEREKETLIPETRQAETVSPSRHSGNELKSFETLQPGERRAPIAYSPDPLPTQDRKSRIAAVPGVTWVPDDSGNVILGRDDRFREQEPVSLTKKRSIIMLRKQVMARNISGRFESPMARSIAAPML